MMQEQQLYENIWSQQLTPSDMPISPEGETGTIRIDAARREVGTGDRLLDIACGDGSFALLVKPSFREVYGVDISATAVAMAKQRGVHAQRHNLHDGPLPFRAGMFDVVTANAVIEHVFEPRMLVDEAFRVLRPGGRLIINTPNIRYIRHLITLLFRGRFPKTSGDVYLSYDGGHIHYFTFQDLEALLQQRNFHIIRRAALNTIEARKHPVYRLFRLLGKHFEEEFLSSEVFLVAEKPMA